MKTTILKGARTHNLKAVDLDLEPGEVIAITGVSGAGKSSLALDTLYAEGQRRFIESFSPYARQFLERLERPPLDLLEPVPAGVAVDRRAPIKSSRSTLATLADLEAYFSALFTREALPVCPEHGETARRRDASAMASAAIERHPERSSVLTYPLATRGVEHYLEVRERLLAEGYRRIWARGATCDLDDVSPSEALADEGRINVVVDRLKLKPSDDKRLAASLESAWQRADGTAHLRVGDQVETLRSGLVCPTCARALPEGRAGLFSYESPLGACAECRGFGRTLAIDYDKVIPDPQLSLAAGAIRPWNGRSTDWERRELRRFCERQHIPLDRPWAELSAVQREQLMAGDGGFKRGQFPGLVAWFRWLETRTYKMHVRVLLARYRRYDSCSSCSGQRLNALALGFRVGGLNLASWHGLEVGGALERLRALVTHTGQGELVRRELVTRLTYLERVGLGYLRLDRQARSLSGGEAQRVTLTAALGTSLHHALFVLDEPTVGLHASDVHELNGLIHELAARDNVVVVVEHDRHIVESAHRIIELGPGAGAAGGSVVRDTRRARRPSARQAPAAPTFKAEPRPARGFLKVRGARENNLKDVDLDIPLGVICALAGPSGSGKSTLAVDIVYRALARQFGATDVDMPGLHASIEGAAALSAVKLVDQSPLGRTSRGNAATYTKAWDTLRKAFAEEPAAVALGLTASHFSFNVAGGRCEACAGEGFETVEMQFLADVKLSCPTCQGRRFSETVLGVKHRGLNVAELLALTIDQVLALFVAVPAVTRRLAPLAELGLGYLGLGQPLATLSGGEAQRLKLARTLSEQHRGVLFVLDEPSAGLHPTEVGKVLEALESVVQAGGSVLVLDHDLDLLRQADWLIDLGPGAGDRGGSVVAAGFPSEIACLETKTGRALARDASPIPTSERPSATGRSEAGIVVRRAREHNLKDVSVRVPHAALTVVTGPSGSGKSSLAFDVIFAEGQRRFLDTLTPYARQFLPRLPRPDVEAVEGVPPAVALEQRTARAGAQSTVATVTEVAHYLRLLFAKLGVAHCPLHDEPVERRTPAQLLSSARALKGRCELLAPVVRARKGTHLDIFTLAAREGIATAWCDAERVSTDAPPRLARHKEHDLDLVIADELTPANLTAELLERALAWGNGTAKLRFAHKEILLSLRSACAHCDFSAPELDPRWFSFNTAQGRCAACEGAGVIVLASPRRGRKKKRAAASSKKPPPLPGICAACAGTRLAPIPRGVRLKGQRYTDIVAKSVRGVLGWVESLRFAGDEALIANAAHQELLRRVQFLCDVGLEYLTLERAADTLSGGEMQRLRLAAQLGTGLTGALYVLDEPTIGLHPRDTARLLGNLRALVKLGSTVLVVEHDPDTIRAADHLIDLGPGGGTGGGRVIAEGKVLDVLLDPASPTGRALSAAPALRTPLPLERSQAWLRVEGVAENNLKQIDLALPIGRLSVVAGVSGSGKSTLVRRVLLPAVRAALGLVVDAPAPRFARLLGVEGLSRAVAVDQAPIGRTPRSVPATFLGVWDALRRLYAETNQAKVLGFGPARFSFNTANGGRCPACEGQGAVSHEMSFLPDVVTPCATCEGSRFEPQTLEVKYLGYSIADVLRLTMAEAAQVFAQHPKIAAPLSTLHALGAGYLTLGQGSHTLSGGEAQRLKLSKELTAGSHHEPTLYVLDEPTTGLHLTDVALLVDVLSRLVARGDSVVVIEHHPIVIAGADWVVELGPEGGERGGEVVFAGTPEDLSRAETETGRVVRELRPHTPGPSSASARRRSKADKALRP